MPIEEEGENHETVGTFQTCREIRGAGDCKRLEARELRGRPVHYTRAFASCEKGAVENANRIIRRWFLKSTDFSKVSREDVLAVEAIVNSIHRRSRMAEKRKYRRV